ncbi:amino-acid N-acetyltransferase [Halomonas halocynthiae]|uniref:amino-acid N-acetyltransferase n=1 Tax=Halomonas halocynthiae TaxID=176290 RepID=UPI0003F80848|nr:amino-acid N-acetyltransferase [Halomonas halocynthiae]
MSTRFPFVGWFRNSSPYINAHRGQTFVILIEGEAVAQGRGEQLIQDLALLHTLGVRLVVVLGIRAQLAAALDTVGITPDQHLGRWVADDDTMALVERVAAEQRLWLEARLSLGLPNSPLHGVDMTVVSGNLVMAKPLGVRDGVDFERSGEVRRVRKEALEQLLATNSLVLLPPIGFSSTGEVFELEPADVACRTAIALGADKLILLGEASGLTEAGVLQRQLTPCDADAWLGNTELGSELSRHLAAACEAARQGVARTHLISWQDHEALLGELFTRDGVGTMITQQRYEQLRQAQVSDIGGLLELVAPLERNGMLVARSRERLEVDIDDYLVVERDGMIIACAALHSQPDSTAGELACVVVHADYRGADRGELLLSEVIRLARERGLDSLFVLTTHTAHWFVEHGFRPAELSELPSLRRETYNHARRSRILIKALD